MAKVLFTAAAIVVAGLAWLVFGMYMGDMLITSSPSDPEGGAALGGFLAFMSGAAFIGLVAFLNGKR